MSECVECGADKNIINHHTSYESNDIVSVCRSCHGLIHNDPKHELYPEDNRPQITSKRIVVHDSVDEAIETVTEDRGISKKEAVRDVFKEADYDV